MKIPTLLNESRWRRFGLLLPLLFGLCACEVDSRQAGLPGRGGTGSEYVRKGNLVVLGPISAITGNTLTVEGEDWDISRASIGLRDTSALRPGMIVRLVLRDQSHNVAELEAGPEVVGQISAIDADAGVAIINDTRIQLGSFTRSDAGAPLATAAEGDWVEVSGLPDFSNGGNGGLAATLWQPVSGPLPLRNSGQITSVDADTQSFVLSDGSYDYAGSTFPDADLAADDLSDGQTLRLELPDADPLHSGNITPLRILPWQYTPANFSVLMSGRVTVDKKGSRMFVAGHELIIDSHTRFENLDITDITNGDLLRVEGIVTGGGRIESKSIERLD